METVSVLMKGTLYVPRGHRRLCCDWHNRVLLLLGPAGQLDQGSQGSARRALTKCSIHAPEVLNSFTKWLALCAKAEIGCTTALHGVCCLSCRSALTGEAQLLCFVVVVQWPTGPSCLLTSIVSLELVSTCAVNQTRIIRVRYTDKRKPYLLGSSGTVYVQRLNTSKGVVQAVGFTVMSG
jgi:hypothetical protein